MKEKILLHICCAPCSVSAVETLKKDFDISFYWYNPNIFDNEEYINRKDSAVKYAKSLGIDFFEEEDFTYDYNAWKSKSLEICENCYDIRLGKLVSFAKSKGFKFFSTSLLSSPYQKHDIIKGIAKKYADSNSINFVYHDFRDKFYEGKNSLRREGYYIQKYCGCNKSYKERFKKNEK